MTVLFLNGKNIFFGFLTKTNLDFAVLIMQCRISVTPKIKVNRLTYLVPRNRFIIRERLKRGNV